MMRWRITEIWCLTLLLACGGSSFDPGAGGEKKGTPAQGVRFAAPLAGTLNADYFYTNYKDHDASAGIRDYRCQQKTYNGHNGTDIVLPSFARMDAGVDVQAAAPGRVMAVQDGMPDRNKSWDAGGGFGNHVVVRHRDDVTSIYAHLMRGSVAVAVGDSVETGAVLGQVGSSGMSDMPHLHIEFRRAGQPFDAYAGPCHESASSWVAQLAYQDAFRVIAHDLAGGTLNLDIVKDPPASVASVAVGQPVFHWIHLHNVVPGMTTRWEFERPDGSTTTGTRTHDRFFSMSWWWAGIAPQQAGTWRARLYHDNTLLSDRTFTVTGVVATGPVPAAPAFPRVELPVVSGGALGVHRLHDQPRH